MEYRIDHPERGVRWIAGRGDWDVRSNDATLTGICIDITEQKSRQENANLLMRELHHRMRNLFATVGAIISLTRHSARDVDDYVERISSRRSEEHTSELQSLMRISYAVLCLKKKNTCNLSTHPQLITNLQS